MTDTRQHDGPGGCADQIRTRMHPAEITISTQPPLIRGPWTTDGMTCPHGVTYWIEPTGEQIAEWRREAIA